jgi:Holliday junction DNA helicase RuvA
VIASVRGAVLATGLGWVVLDVGGVGLRAEVTASQALQARTGHELTLLTSLVVREDSLTLFGFSNATELELFGHLIAVSGVGPRSALGVLSALTTAEIVRAVATEDEKPFKKVSGVGPKTAKLIAVSLQGKVEHLATIEDRAVPAARGEDAHVVQGLIGLGWPESDAVDAVTGARENIARENIARVSITGESIAPVDPAALLRAALARLQAPRARGRAGTR